ncbi:hypothetical protein N7540_012180 [Penicillium herquei]|nr:hypothetical protein N7540_012180 [Penicillium herquei]
MASKTGRPAMVEEFDEKLRIIVPDSQQVANTCAKVSNRLDHRHPEPLIDGASDSGYSSRTVNSTQSGPSGGRSPPAPLTDLPKHRPVDLTRKSSRRDRRDKDRAARPLEDNMQMGHYPGAAHPHVSRSPSKSYRHDSYRSPPEVYYEEGPRYHQSSTPVDNRSMDYHTPSLMRPPMPDYAPHLPPPPPLYPTEEYHSSRSARPGGYRPPMYYQDPRPGPYAVGMPRAYPQQQFQYEQHQHQPPQHHGPPPSSVWQQGPYSSSPYGGGGGGGGGGGPPSYGQPDYFSQDAIYGGHRERSESRPREPSRARRSSMYGHPQQPPMEYDDYSPEYDDNYEEFYAPDPRELTREKHHAMKQMQLPDREDARRQMPPPSLPSSRQKAAPQIHQARRPERRSQSVAPSRRHSKIPIQDDLIDDFEDLELEPSSHRRSSRDVSTPDSRDSLRGSRRYHGGSRSGGQVAVANSIRRNKHEDYYHDSQGSSLDMENQTADAEQYQEQISGRAQLPASEETMMPKSRNGAGSDVSSRKSGSNGSRASATKTEKEKEKQAMTLSLNGMTLNFDNDGFQGKAISIRTGDRGSTQLNITDGSTPAPAPPPAPKRSSKSYVGAGSSYSDNTGASSRRRALEDIQRHRDREDRRLEKSAHRTSRSGRSSYGGTRYH